ncbi:adenylate/guanylate cyclase domain-containing protein [Bradyrhizobium sp. Rc2d]|uniref:adenylate/guanylate cyclase domain-containing protein n=1 Tax=Bradyrhizobium sp. Rc2d TaxID=1855321 RepID=UPI0032E0509A
MCGPSFRRSACRPWCCTARPTLCRSRTASSWRRRFPGAKFVAYADCSDHLIFPGDRPRLCGDIEEFVTGHREATAPDFDRVLATVLFADIVDSTRRAAEMGDQAWRRMLDEHDQAAQRIVVQHRGNLVKTTGDGILATFDGPGRAIRCALAFEATTRRLGLPVRAGLHTGEIELRDGGDIDGIAVHAAARVMAQAGPDEVLVSRVVTDLVAGAGLRFSDRGAHELKGLPGAGTSLRQAHEQIASARDLPQPLERLEHASDRRMAAVLDFQLGARPARPVGTVCALGHALEAQISAPSPSRKTTYCRPSRFRPTRFLQPQLPSRSDNARRSCLRTPANRKRATASRRRDGCAA